MEKDKIVVATIVGAVILLLAMLITTIVNISDISKSLKENSNESNTIQDYDYDSRKMVMNDIEENKD